MSDCGVHHEPVPCWVCQRNDELALERANQERMMADLWRPRIGHEKAEGWLENQEGTEVTPMVRVPAGALLIEDGFDRAAKRMSRSLYEIIQKVGKLTEDRTLDQLCGALLRAAAGEGER